MKLHLITSQIVLFRRFIYLLTGANNLKNCTHGTERSLKNLVDYMRGINKKHS